VANTLRSTKTKFFLWNNRSGCIAGISRNRSKQAIVFSTRIADPVNRSIPRDSAVSAESAAGFSKASDYS
jgi:hypothetical protein